MNMNVTSEKFEITKGILDHLSERLEKVEKFDLGKVDVRFTKEGKDNKVTLETVVNKKKVEVSKTSSDLYAAIDKATHALKESIVKVKKKSVDKKLKGAKKANKKMEKKALKQQEFILNESQEFILNESAEIKAPVSVDRKNISEKPMSEQEAILQMETLDHNFLLFHNTNTKTPCVMYENKNGDYVLLDTVTESNIDFN